jgi:hypothetical protein
VIFTLSKPGCGALVAVLAAVVARICSIGLPPPLAPLLAPIEPVPSPFIRSVTTLSLQSSKALSADGRQTLAGGGLS